MLSKLRASRLTIILMICLVVVVVFLGSSVSLNPPAPLIYTQYDGNESGAHPLAPPVISEQEQSKPGQQASQQRVVIKNANLRIIVDNPEETLNTVSRLADEMGGWVVTSKTYKNVLRSGKQVLEAAITIRVAADRFIDALERIKKSAISVDSSDISGQDVTQEYTDLNSQLTNLEAAEAQLRKIMDAAEKTEGVLSVYKELVNVRGQIESVKGRLQFYKESAAYSSIALTIVPNDQDTPLAVSGWNPGGTAKSAFEGLVSTLQSLANLLIYLVIGVLPLLLIVGIPGWLIFCFVRRRMSTLPPKAQVMPQDSGEG
jgi:hypothetical protein